MSQLLGRERNLGLISSRAVNDLYFAHCFVTTEPVDKIAIIRDFLNPTFEVITSDLAAIDARGLPRQTHNLTKLMQRGFRLRRKRREYVAQVYCVVGVPIEIGAGR